MLEFYYKHQRKIFKHKAKKLAYELTCVFETEKINVMESKNINISEEYKPILGNELFSKLNNLYFTIRSSKAKNHFLLNKYLPENKKELQSNFLFADFFSGAGGLSKGMVNAGFQPAFVNDSDITALETYYFNHTLPLDRIFAGDIQELLKDIEHYKPFFKNIKVVAGGPPCQGFSSANRNLFEIDPHTNEKRFIEDPRNELYKYFVKLLGLIRPDFFIMENVRGMAKVEKQIEEDIQQATQQSYSFLPFVLNAQSFDVPQSRTRYVLIGATNFMFIEQIKKSITAKKNGTSQYKLKDALYGLPVISTNPIKLNPEYESEAHGFAIRKLKVKQNEFLREINKGKEISYLLNHKSRYNNENDLQIFRLLPEGENSLHPSIQELNNYRNRDRIFKDKYYKLKRDEVSKTITSHMKYDCHMYIHPEQARGLSPREAARLQTFPDEYVFRGSLNDWYQQIGNAVPVKLAEIIAKELMKFYK